LTLRRQYSAADTQHQHHYEPRVYTTELRTTTGRRYSIRDGERQHVLQSLDRRSTNVQAPASAKDGPTYQQFLPSLKVTIVNASQNAVVCDRVRSIAERQKRARALNVCDGDQSDFRRRFRRAEVAELRGRASNAYEQNHRCRVPSRTRYLHR